MIPRNRLVSGGNQDAVESSTYNQYEAPTWLEVGVLFGREDSENVVIFMNRFAVVSSFLLVPPVTRLECRAGSLEVVGNHTSRRMDHGIAS